MSMTSLHRHNNSRDSSTERTTSPSLSRQNSNDSIIVPRTLNARASLIMASSSSSGSPRNTTTTTTTTTNRPLPRLRVASVGEKHDLSSHLFTRGSDGEESLDYSGTDESEMRECEALEKTRKFITDTIKYKNKPPHRMSVGNINFFDQPLSSGASSEEFCVTEHSSPCGTPPPERVMSSDVSFREVARLKSDIRTLRNEIKHMHKQQQEMNNFHYTLVREREEETKSRCFFFSWF